MNLTEAVLAAAQEVRATQQRTIQAIAAGAGLERGLQEAIRALDRTQGRARRVLHVRLRDTGPNELDTDEYILIDSESRTHTGYWTGGLTPAGLETYQQLRKDGAPAERARELAELLGGNRPTLHS